MGDVLSLAIIGDQLFAGFQDTRIRNMTLDLIESKVSSPSLLRSIDDHVRYYICEGELSKFNQKSASGLNLTLRHVPKPVLSASKCCDTPAKKVSFVAPMPVPPKPAHASQLISTEGAEEVPVDLKEFGDSSHFGFVCRCSCMCYSFCDSFVHSLVVRENKLFSGAGDGMIKVWDMKTGACLASLIGHCGSVLALAATSDNTLLSGSRYSVT